MSNTKIIIFSLILLLGCSSTNFDNPNDYITTIDESVGCSNITATTSDISLKITSDKTMIVKSNARQIGGLYLNSILSKQREFVDDSVYTLSGEFLVPASAQNEQLDINLQRVENHTEYHAEILWDLNPDNKDLYEWIWTRGQDLNKPIKLFKLSDDHNWHGFISVVRYTSNPKHHIFESITVDGNYKLLNVEMGNLPKEWDSSFGTLLETTNRYTGCTTLNTTVGEGQWRNIVFERKDITN